MTAHGNLRKLSVLLPADLADKLEESRRNHAFKHGEGLSASAAAVNAIRAGLAADNSK